MTRIRCLFLDHNGAGSKRCNKHFRAQSGSAKSDIHNVCREHYRLENGEAKPIESRMKSENKYRRCRSRKKFVSGKKVVVQSKGRKKNQQSTSIE